MRVVLLCALVIGCTSAQYVKSGVKGGHGGQGYGHHTGENMVSLFGNRTQQGSTQQHGTSYGHTEVGVCYIEVPTATLAKDPRHVPAGNGSRPDLSVIRSCCSGYERNPYNYRLCDPVCSKQCVNGICTAPETCSCFPDHVRNYAGACVATCPIGCLHGRCAGGECMCNEGYVLDFDSKYCIPTCKENCGNLGNCTALNVCTCRPGYKSTHEGNCKPDCGRCVNGECVTPNECRCLPGYSKDSRGECVTQCTRGCGPNEKCVGPNRCEPVTLLVPGQSPQQPYYPSPYPDHRNQTTSRPGYPYPTQNPNNPDQNQYPGQPNYFVPPGGNPSQYPPTSENQVRNYSTPNGSQIPQQPGYQPGNQPGNQPGYQPGNQPGYQPGYQPGNQPGYQPGYQPGNQPGYYPGYQPGHQPGNQPGYQPGNQPGNQPGYQPGHHPGNQPGYQPGHQPTGNPSQHTPSSGNPAPNGSQIPYQPGSQPGYQPGQQPAYPPGSQPIYRPGPQPGYQPGYQPGFQPGYQPGQQPGYYPGYQPGYPPGYPGFGISPNQTYPGYMPAYFQPGYYQPNLTAPGQNQPGQQPAFRPDYAFYQPMYPNPYALPNNTLPGQPPNSYPGNQPAYPHQRNPNGTGPNEIYPGSQPVNPNGYPTQNGGNPATAPNSTYPGQGPYPTPEHAVNHSPNFFNPYGPDNNQQYSQNVLCSFPCVNGQCVGVDRCACNHGYIIDHSDPSGFSCKPVCVGGCVNGVCTAPNVCVCNEGYSMNTGVKGRMMCVKRIRRAAPVLKKPQSVVGF